jgi:hypothetical protein
VHTICELRTERAQLDMQLIVARVAAAATVASEASKWTSFEAAWQPAEDRATTAHTAAAAATTEWDAGVKAGFCRGRGREAPRGHGIRRRGHREGQDHHFYHRSCRPGRRLGCSSREGDARGEGVGVGA